jgi:ribonuclease G
LNLSLRAVRDLLLQEAEKLVIDSKKDFDSVLTFLDTFNPSLKDSVELFEGNEPIFDAYNLEGDISRALKRKVWLKSGGYIVIEHTEALVAIDVNTGRYVGKYNLEETIFKTNLEAVKGDCLPNPAARYWWYHHHRFYRHGKKIQSGKSIFRP